ncbi:hypothetical protein ABTU70_19640, partial [Acinetobacter baumannii]
GNVIHCTSFEYDTSHNVTKETLRGNLTGKYKKSFKIQADKTPDFSLGESYTLYCEYSKDGFNLLTEKRDDFGYRETYRYQPGTNLLTH